MITPHPKWEPLRLFAGAQLMRACYKTRRVFFLAGQLKS